MRPTVALGDQLISGVSMLASYRALIQSSRVSSCGKSRRRGAPPALFDQDYPDSGQAFSRLSFEDCRSL